MTVNRIGLAAVGALATLSFAQAASAQSIPMRRPGLWDMNMAMQGMAGMTMNMKQCTTFDSEKANSAFASNPNNRGGGNSHCAPVNISRTPGGMSFNVVCKSGGSTVETKGVVNGDFQGRYHMETFTHISPGSGKDAHAVIDAKWVGPCPARCA